MSVRVSDSVAISVRGYTSLRHLQSAAILCRETASAQAAWSGIGPTFDEMGWNRIVASTTGVVFLSAAFLESAVNELLCDCHEGFFGESSRAGLPEPVRAELARLWPKYDKTRRSALGKWKDILQVAGKQPDPRLESEVEFLFRFRNALTHPKPESVTISSSTPDRPVEKHSLEEGAATRFGPNPKTLGTTGEFFGLYLAHPCAEWSFLTALHFADDAWTRLGVPPAHVHIRDRLATR